MSCKARILINSNVRSSRDISTLQSSQSLLEKYRKLIRTICQSAWCWDLSQERKCLEVRQWALRELISGSLVWWSVSEPVLVLLQTPDPPITTISLRSRPPAMRQHLHPTVQWQSVLWGGTELFICYCWILASEKMVGLIGNLWKWEEYCTGACPRDFKRVPWLFQHNFLNFSVV